MTGDPPRAVRSHRAAGDEAVQVQMLREILAPRVQDRGDPDRAAEVPRIAAEREPGDSSEPVNAIAFSAAAPANNRVSEHAYSQTGTGRSFSQRMKSRLGGSPPNARSLVAHWDR